MPDIPELARREPLHRVVEAVQLSDKEMARILRDAADESARLIASYGQTFSSRVRTAQLGLARIQQEMWATVHSQTKVGIGDGADAAAMSSSYLDDLMFNDVGMTSAWWRSSQLATARAGIPNLISRRENGITLSQRVYKNSVGARGNLQRMIDAMVINGASAREIAKRARGFIHPDTPGGASYAAMRLGRSELNNSFHQTSKRLNADKPWVNGMKWNLSRSHPKPDICDELVGVYDKHEVPGKPHPQCFCYTTPETPSREEFAANFANGAYDEYLGSVGCGVA